MKNYRDKGWLIAIREGVGRDWPESSMMELWGEMSATVTIFFLTYILFIYLCYFIYLHWASSQLWHVGSSSLTRDQTCAPCNKSAVLATGSPGKSPASLSWLWWWWLYNSVFLAKIRTVLQQGCILLYINYTLIKSNKKSLRQIQIRVHSIK